MFDIESFGNFQEICQFIKQYSRAATVHIPKPPPGKTIEGIKRRRELAREREAVVSYVIYLMLRFITCTTLLLL